MLSLSVAVCSWVRCTDTAVVVANACGLCWRCLGKLRNSVLMILRKCIPKELGSEARESQMANHGSFVFKIDYVGTKTHPHWSDQYGIRRHWIATELGDNNHRKLLEISVHRTRSSVTQHWAAEVAEENQRAQAQQILNTTSVAGV